MNRSDFPAVELTVVLAVFWFLSDPSRIQTMKPRAYLFTSQCLQHAARIIGELGMASERAYHAAMETAKI